MSDLLLLPNIASEEDDGERRRAPEPAIATVGRLWHQLFGGNAVRLRATGAGPAHQRDWPTVLGPEPPAALHPELEAGACLWPWLASETAARIAADHGVPLAGADPIAVTRTHDKAFAARVAREERLDPPSLRGIVRALAPEDLADPDAAMAEIDASLADWPTHFARRFVLKPRFGSSGRGRVAAGWPVSDQDRKEIRGALPRLARRGGAMLEPWLDRVGDFSSQLWIAPGGEIRLLGTTELRVATSGLYRGQRGTLDNKGRITSDSEHDEALREASALVAVAARDAGYRGPCGVDAFSFRDPDGGVSLRPVVEFNARFTLGTLVLGLLRRGLKTIKKAVPAPPEVRRVFHFGLDAPAGGWPDPEPDGRAVLLPLGHPDESPDPALLVARDPDTLHALLGDDA